MRELFINWLKSYKEYSDNKAANTVALLDKMSDFLVLSDSTRAHFFCITKFIEFAKNRQSLMSIYELSGSEKKTLELYGDFLQVMEISHLKLTNTSESQLVHYIKSMRMSYSYKAVLLLSLLETCRATTIEDITTEIMAYYASRIDQGFLAEREQSVFSRKNIPMKDARNTIVSNPIKVLCEAEVIAFSEQSGTVTLTSAYLPHADEMQLARELLFQRLNKYYEGLATINSIPPEVDDALNLIRSYIAVENEPQDYLDALEELKQNIADLYSRKSQKSEEKKAISPQVGIFSPILPEDERKVGKLVRETMSALSSSGYVFDEQTLRQLLDKDLSKKLFNVNYPFFREYDPDRPLNDQRKDHNGEGRYWSVVFAFGEKRYLITSEWYIGDRPFFIKWFNNNVAH